MSKIKTKTKNIQTSGKRKRAVARATLKPGKGTKYPVNTAEHFIKLLKSLNANASNKGLDINKVVLFAKAYGCKTS